MPSYTRLTELGKMDMADRALRALATDDAMLARMALRGFPQDRLDEGRALVEAVRRGRRTQDSELGEQFDATDDAGDAWLAAKKPYVKEVKFAKTALADDRGALEDLGLLERRRIGRVPAMDQAHNFYSSALARPDLTKRLGAVGLDRATLEAGLARVEAVAETRGEQQGEHADATRATKAKRKAKTALDGWMGPFLETARAEFSDDPEELDRLGL